MYVRPAVRQQVGFLCVETSKDRGVEKVPIGTCFWVGVPNHQQNCAFGYLITAKHVWEGLQGHTNVYVRLNKFKVNEGESGITYVKLPNNWIFHSDPAVDLAALPWPVGIVSKPNFSFVFFSLDEIGRSPESFQEEGLSWPPNEGEDVIYVGLMTQYSGYERNFPVVRRGHVALVTDEPVMGYYGLSNYYFIDMQIYPGHSGGPVWVVYPTQKTGVTLFLLGVLVAAHPERQELLEVPRHYTGRTPKQEKIGYYNMGISMVVPVARVVEILKSPEVEEMRKRGEPKPVKPAASGQSEGFTKND